MSLSYQPPEDPVEEELIVESVPIPPPYYTFILLAAMVVVAVVQLSTGLEESILKAGFVKPAFLHANEYWRILTGAATHGSVAHIAMNGFAFYSFGRIFEMLSNSAHLALVFLASALVGGLLSLAFVPEGNSVGASGGIVGLISYLAIYSFRRKNFITREFRKSLLINIGFIVLFGLALYRVIDNYAHIGGLITGAVYGFIQIPKDEFVDPRAASSVTELLGLGAVGIYLAACLFSVLLIIGTV